MAKGKHAAALFEVIHASKQFGGKEKGAGLLRTPKWWFKGRKSGEEPTSSTSSAPQAASAPEVVDAAVPEEPPSELSQDPEPAPESAATPAARRPAVDVLVDPQLHQITFRVSYTSAIVSAFTVLVIVSLAYLVGRNMARGPASALGGPSSEQLRQGPAQPQVLDVGSGGQPASRAAVARQDNISAPPIPLAAPTTITPPSERRIQSLNYVIIQGYPDEASAKAALEMLQQNGVSCTIERGLRGLKSDWFIVVGTDGFGRISGRDYEDYVKRIQQISDKFATRKSFKAFEPMPYKWDRP